MSNLWMNLLNLHLFEKLVEQIILNDPDFDQHTLIALHFSELVANS